MQNVVELVTRVQIAKTLRNARVLGGGTFHADGGLGPLAASFKILVLGGVADLPIVHFLVPLCNLLILAVLLWGHHVLDDHILQLKLVSQLVNGVVHVIALAVEIITDSIQLLSGVLVLLPEFLKLLVFEIKLFGQRAELLLDLRVVLVLFLKFHLQFSLKLDFLLQVCLGLLKLFLLGLSDFHGLVTSGNLFLHLLEFLKHLLLLALRLLLGILSRPKLIE